MSRPKLGDEYGDFVRDKNGSVVVIQEHSLGHAKGDVGLYFNVRPISDLNPGYVSGTHGHYNLGITK